MDHTWFLLIDTILKPYSYLNINGPNWDFTSKDIPNLISLFAFSGSLLF